MFNVPKIKDKFVT